MFPRYAGRIHRGATIVGDNRRGTVVVLENAPKSLSRHDEASVLRACRQRGDELIAETLVVSFCRSQNTDAKLLIYKLFQEGRVLAQDGVTRCLSEDFEAFRKRDLSNEKLLYLELDGTYLRYHQGAERKEPILVATGYRADGTRVLLHIGVGNRESYENWKGFLQEMVARGMREPLLIVTDGNPGVLKAIAEVFPRSLKQRCQKHRLENILGKAPKEVRDELKAAILESFHANSYEQGLKKGREVIARYRQRFPSAMKCMEETLEACLQALRLPAAHHKRLRTSNLLERTFGEHKRRTKVIPHFFTEEAAMKLSFAVLLAVANKWRGVRMDVFAARKVEELRNELLPQGTSEESAA